MAPTPCRARYSRYANPSKSSGSSSSVRMRSRSPLAASIPRGIQASSRSPSAIGRPSTSATRSPSTSWIRSSRGRGSSITVPASSCSTPSTSAGDRWALGLVVLDRSPPGARPRSPQHAKSTAASTSVPPARERARPACRPRLQRPRHPGARRAAVPARDRLRGCRRRPRAVRPAARSGRCPRLTQQWRRPGCPPAARG